MLRNFCFTINNYTEEEYNNVKNNGAFGYCILAKEVGKEGTPHIQGYAELRRRTRFNTVKTYMPRAHIESRKGTQSQAIEYCKKDNNFEEIGEKANQGRRHDLDKVRENALDGGMREISTLYSQQQIRVAEKFLTYCEEPRSWKPTVYWIWGPTGVGKSRLARELCDENDLYTKNTPNKWWEGYDAHEYVIVDDFRPDWWSLTYMLGLLDRYEFRVEYKGGLRQFKPKLIVITSCLAPDECYQTLDEDIGQLLRRLDRVDYLEGVPDVPEVGGNT